MIFNGNIIMARKKKKYTDEDEIRTHAGKPQWISSPSP